MSDPTTPPLKADELTKLVQAGREMRKRHIREQQTEDRMMKVLFALMCPLLALFPDFWRD